MKSFVLHRYLIRIHWARKGWWITDRKGYEHHLPFSVQRIISPEGQTAWRITAWSLNIEMGKTQHKETLNEGEFQ